MKCIEVFQAAVDLSRPPRGGRGLKLNTWCVDTYGEDVAPLAGGVD